MSLRQPIDIKSKKYFFWDYTCVKSWCICNNSHRIWVSNHRTQEPLRSKAPINLMNNYFESYYSLQWYMWPYERIALVPCNLWTLKFYAMQIKTFYLYSKNQQKIIQSTPLWIRSTLSEISSNINEWYPIFCTLFSD